MLALADLGAVGLAVATLSLTAGLETGLWAAALIPVWGLIAKAQGLYDADHARVRHLTSDEGGALFYWATLSVAVLALALSLLPPGAMSGPEALLTWAVALVSGALLRTGARALWRRLVPPERGLVVGRGPLAEAVRRKLTLERSHHLQLVLEPAPDPATTERFGAELADTLARAGVDRVILAAPDLDEEHLAAVVSACRARRTKLSVAPPLRAMLGTAVSLTHLAELPLIEFRSWDPSRSTMAIKRALDVTVATTGLVLLSPLMGLIAVVIKLDSPGPALFRQRRVGREGEVFEMVKFRTMVRDAEQRIDELVVLDELTTPVFKLREDPRVTRFGALLRRTSLDELPQLINVFRGQMSLVGPRPEWLRLAQRYTEAEQVGRQMRPGMTGPMQVHGRGELDFGERLAVEREYVENHSLRKDLKIIWRTIGAVVRGHGAY